MAKSTLVLWDHIPWEEVKDNISRRLVMRDRMMMVMYRFEPHATWPVEGHEAEQAGYIISGRAELNLPSEGKKVILKPGDGYFLGSNVPHGWRTLEEQVVNIDIFSPPRMELLKKKFAPNAE
jgi:quercetin dioxygenase-like cupin family protein